MIEVIPDSSKTHWVNRAPVRIRPYLQLSRLDRPIGYWLLALPGWIGLSFAGLKFGYSAEDVKWAALILIGAIAMRGAGCTYNDIVDRDLDAQVARTALRPLPAGTVTPKQAWIWLFAQCTVGLIVLLMLPHLAQIISLLSIPLVAAYPFMKRITWWPQLWLGLTFNWAILVAYAIKTGGLDWPVVVFYLGLMFWTVGYDTIYACQDIEDDALIGVKSTARRFGGRIRAGVAACYALFVVLAFFAVGFEIIDMANSGIDANFLSRFARTQLLEPTLLWFLPLIYLLFRQVAKLEPGHGNALRLFKSNVWVAFFLIFLLCGLDFLFRLN